MMPVRLEPTAPRSRVKHSTTEPLRSLDTDCVPERFLLSEFEKVRRQQQKHANVYRINMVLTPSRLLSA